MLQTCRKSGGWTIAGVAGLVSVTGLAASAGAQVTVDQDLGSVGTASTVLSASTEQPNEVDGYAGPWETVTHLAGGEQVYRLELGGNARVGLQDEQGTPGQFTYYLYSSLETQTVQDPGDPSVSRTVFGPFERHAPWVEAPLDLGIIEAGVYYLVVEPSYPGAYGQTFGITLTTEILPPLKTLDEVSSGTIEPGSTRSGDTYLQDNEIDLARGPAYPPHGHSGGDDVWTLDWAGGNLGIRLEIEPTRDLDLGLIGPEGEYAMSTQFGDQDEVLGLPNVPAGRYYVVIDSATPELEGSYTLRVETLPDLPTLEGLSLGTLERGSSVSGTTAGVADSIDLMHGPRYYEHGWAGGDAVWKLDWDGGAILLGLAEVGSAEFDLALLDEWGEMVAFGIGDYGNAEAVRMDLAAGSYTVVIDSETDAQEGAYELTVRAAGTPKPVASGNAMTGNVWRYPMGYFGDEYNGLSIDTVEHDVVEIEVTAAGVYTLSTATGEASGVTPVYADAFDPANAYENLVALSETAYDGQFSTVVRGVAMEPGRSYFVAVSPESTWAPLTSYAIAADGPGTVREVGACPADRDNDGDKDVQDLLSYLRSFRARNADMDGDQDTDVQDLLGYLRAFRAGC